MNDDVWIKRFEEPIRTGNWVLDLHPLVKFNFMVVCSVMDFMMKNIYFSLFLVILAYAVAAAAGRLKSFNRLFSKVILIFGLFWVLFQAAFSGEGELLFELGGIHVTQEGIIQGLASSLLILGFSGSFLLFFQITTMDKFMLALENLGMPRTGSFVFLSTFQSIMDLGVNAKVIQESQKARGIETEGNALQRLKAYIPVVGPLVLNAVASTEEKTIAMEARAFSAKTSPTHLCILPRIDSVQLVLLVVMNAAMVGSVALRIGGFL